MSGPVTGIDQFLQAPGGIAGVAASNAAGGAAAGGGFLASLALPGVGTAISIGATLLGSLFGGGDDAELQQWRDEVARQEAEKNRATQVANQARENILESFTQGTLAERGQFQDISSALDRFLR